MITTINDGGETGLSEWKKIYLDSTSHEPPPPNNNYYSKRVRDINIKTKTIKLLTCVCKVDLKWT